jgi:hypothetical protein
LGLLRAAFSLADWARVLRGINASGHAGQVPDKPDTAGQVCRTKNGEMSYKSTVYKNAVAGQKRGAKMENHVYYQRLNPCPSGKNPL